MEVYSGNRLMKKLSLLSTDGCFQRVWMWGTSRALQMDCTALTEELCEGPNTAPTPRASWSQARVQDRERWDSYLDDVIFLQTSILDF